MRQLFIVQSKWIQNGTGEPDLASVGKMCQGIKDLFNLSFDRFNQKLQDRQPEMERALKEYDTRYQVIVADTGDRGLAEHSQRVIDDLLVEMNDAGDGTGEPLVTFQRWNQARTHTSLAAVAGGNAIDLEVGLTNWGKVDAPYTAFYGMVAGQEIAEWWKQFGRQLFEKNIRQVLGTTDVNTEMKSTLTENGQLFWYFNNGITIVADTLSKSAVGGTNRDAGMFKLTGAQVVNGAQTVSSIGRFVEADGDLTDVRVMMRLISLQDTPERFGFQVTRSNNRQNRIENRDFASQDTEQVRIKTELRLEGVEYSIVRSDSYKPGPTAFDLNEGTIALACAECDSGMAVQAKREIGKFYEDLSAGIYKRLFNPLTTGDYVWNCVQVVREVDRVLAEMTKALPKRSGRQYGLLVHGNRLVAAVVFRDGELAKSAKTEGFSIDGNKIESLVRSAVGAISQCLDTDFADNMLGTLFKNATKSSQVYGAVQATA